MFVLFVNPDTKKVDRLFEKVSVVGTSESEDNPSHLLITTTPTGHEPIDYFIPIASLTNVEVQVMEDDFWRIN